MNDNTFTYTLADFDEATQSQIVRFSGYLDKAHLPEVKEDIEKFVYAFPGKVLAFDFSQLLFVNSESIGFLMMLHAHLKKEGKTMCFLQASQPIYDVLRVIGVTRMVPVCDTIQQCLLPIQPSS